MTAGIRHISCTLMFATLAACGEPEEPATDGFRLGALLPFTGDVSASGSNSEHAILMVVEAINDTGGLGGVPVRVLARDTHSETSRGLTSANALLDADVAAILGPQEDELAKRMVPLIRERRVVQVSGGVTSPTLSTAEDSGYWFRTITSSREMARALADRMQRDGVRRAAVLYEGTEFGIGFETVLQSELGARGISAGRPISFQPSGSSYETELATVLEAAPDSIALIAQPSSGAQIIQQYSGLGRSTRWYLSPTLRTEVFVNNIPPRVLEGAVGVTAALGDDRATFAETFAARWNREPALDEAYYYYDAAAVTLLAAYAAHLRTGRVPSGPDIREELAAVAGPPGEPVAWNELDRAVELLRAGQDIDYRGASGSVDFDVEGDVPVGRAVFWGIRNGRLINEP